MVRDLRKDKYLNYLEFLSLFGNYSITYFKSLISDDNKDNRKALLSNLKNYFMITKKENEYFSYIINNYSKIQDYDTLAKILNKIDAINEVRYRCYSSLEENYYEAMQEGKKHIIRKDAFHSLDEALPIEQEIVGLTLSKEDLISYYQKEDAIYYLLDRTRTMDADLNQGLAFYGCFPQVENGIVKNINIYVPKIKNLATMKINIHEYKHGIDLFSQLGKTYVEQDYELPAKEEERKFVKTLKIKGERISKRYPMSRTK